MEAIGHSSFPFGLTGTQDHTIISVGKPAIRFAIGSTQVSSPDITNDRSDSCNSLAEANSFCCICCCSLPDADLFPIIKDADRITNEPVVGNISHCAICKLSYLTAIDEKIQIRRPAKILPASTLEIDRA